MNDIPYTDDESVSTAPVPPPLPPSGGRHDEHEQAQATPEAEREDDRPAGMPPIPESVREAGRAAPDHWLGVVDPAWTGDGAPPSWALIGHWRSGLDGEIAEWRDNEDYRPSPRALGWPEPADGVDAAVQLAATGYGDGDTVIRALASAEVAVLVAAQGSPVCAMTPDGRTPVVPVFTSPVHLHAAGRFGYELTTAKALVDRIPEGHLLYLNPSAAASMTVDPQTLSEAADSARQEEAAAAGLRPAVVSGTPDSDTAGEHEVRAPASEGTQESPTAAGSGTSTPASAAL